MSLPPLAALLLAHCSLGWAEQEIRPNRLSTAEKRAAAVRKLEYDTEAARIRHANKVFGTRVFSSPKVTTPEGFAARLSSLNQVPPDRLAYYSWLNDSKKVKCNGWNLTVVDVQPRDGSVLVKVIVGPELIGINGDSYYTSASLEEIYEHTSSNIRLIETKPLTFGHILIDP